jgi:N-acetylmuramoyl-L-alanine amidase
VLASESLRAAKATGESSADHYQGACLLLEDLRVVPQFELGEEQYLLVINAFRRVYESSASKRHGEDSLLQIGRLYSELARRFQVDSHREEALRAYRTLLSEFPDTALREEAVKGMLELGAAPPEETPPLQSAVEAVSSDATAPHEEDRPRLQPVALEVERAKPAPSRPKTGESLLVREIRFWSDPQYTRIVIELDGVVDFRHDTVPNPQRLYIDLMGARLDRELLKAPPIEVGDTLLRRVRVGQNQANTARVVFDLEHGKPFYKISWLRNPTRMVIELRSDKVEQPLQLAVAELDRQQAAASPTLPNSALDKSAAVTTPAASVVAGTPAKPARPAPQRYDPPAENPRTQPAKRAIKETPAPDLAAALPPSPRVDTAAGTPLSPPPAQALEPATPPKAASATSLGNRNLIRALGLKVGRVVIDPGHGGHDTGGIGPNGLREKDLVLDISMRLGKLIEEKLGAEVIYSRTEDGFISLRERTRIANDAKADLFVSVHANSSRTRSVRGVETYYLNFTTDSWAMAVAARENAAAEQNIHQLQDLVSKIALKEKVDESREFAAQVQKAVHSELSKEIGGLRNRGVRKAPFMVLIGAQMPAVLCEVGFISNSQDEKLLKTSAFRQKVAESIFSGLSSYAETLSGVQVAKHTE